MSSNLPISIPNIAAPTPQNTPLTQAPIAAGLSRPTVPDISEDKEEVDDDEDSAQPKSDLPAAMMGMMQSKLASLVGKSSGYIEGLPVETKRSIEALKGVQVKQVELQNRYKRECLELERKYAELLTPLYARRHDIIDGKAKPTAEEIEAGEKQSIKDDEDYVPLPKDSTATSAIPEFWLTALQNHIGLSEIITDRDADALKHLTNVHLEYLPKDGPDIGFKILFAFSPNEFFENNVLEKTYIYQDEIGYEGDFIYDRAVGTEIKWKEDKDLTKEYEIKKQRNKNTNRTRMVRKARPVDSFFNFFSPPVFPTEKVIDSGEIKDDELEELEEKLEVDYQLGEDFKDKIIPRAVDYFTGKALEYEMMTDDESEDFDEDDDDDEDSGSEVELPARQRGPPRRGVPGGDANAECKQQ